MNVNETIFIPSKVTAVYYLTFEQKQVGSDPTFKSRWRSKENELKHQQKRMEKKKNFENY